MKVHTYILRFLQSNFTHYFVLFFIVISILSVIASSFQEMRSYQYSLFAVTYVSSFIFFLEYLARIFSAPALYTHLHPVRARMKYAFSFYGFVDLVACLPWILTYFYWDSQVVHIIILPYIFIIFKLIRHSRSFQIIGHVLVSVKDELTTAYTACLIMVSFSSILMYYIERNAQPDVFRNIGDSFWWAVVTFTTTGYGDIYPITPLGKLLGIIISLIGIAMIAIPTGIIGSAFVNIMQERSREEMERRLKKKQQEEEKEQEEKKLEKEGKLIKGKRENSQKKIKRIFKKVADPYLDDADMN